MDALSEVLRVVRLSSAIFFNARFTAPWCFSSPHADTVMETLHPGAERLVVFHLLTEGSCVLEVEGLAPTVLNAGDVIVFPQGDGHLMASAPGVAPAGPADLQAILRRRPRLLQFGGGGEATRFVCGYLVCDPRLCRSILSALPPVVIVSLRSNGQKDWLEQSIQYAVAEAASPRPGGEGVLGKLSEVLFVETLRRYITQLPPEQTGWLAGLRDRVVGKALSLMHERPAHPWSLETLAREAGASRSVLAERFSHFVAQSPMGYLTRWRLALAANMLRNSAMDLAGIAAEVGYNTDTAFSRAFRREFGMPPATWRRKQRPAPAPQEPVAQPPAPLARSAAGSTSAQA
jgi:AraC-like DNA-binding protein